MFWSKNPAPLLTHLDELDARGYTYAFTFTLTPYGPGLEPGTAQRLRAGRDV